MNKLLIIGSGPAAHTAAIYAARANLEPLLFEGLNAGGIAAGGQLTTTSDVENFPGFPKGISGPDLMLRMREQSLRYGTKIETATVEKIELRNQSFNVLAAGKEYQGHCIILATGATAKRLHVAGEEKFWQKGVSACAVCDGPLPFFRDKKLYVVGGGDSACEEAIFLSKYASHVYLVHRRESLRASPIMAERALGNKKITAIWNAELKAVSGDEKFLNSVALENVHTKKQEDYEAGGLFYAIGHRPNTDFLNGLIDLDQQGYVSIKKQPCYTNVPGILAAGDVYDKKYRQAITAAGSGCIAFFEAEAYLADKGFLS